MISIFKKIFEKYHSTADGERQMTEKRPGLSLRHMFPEQGSLDPATLFTDADAAALANKYGQGKRYMQDAKFSHSADLTKPENVLVLATICTDEPETGIKPGIVYFLYSALCIDVADSLAPEPDAGGLLAAADVETGRVITPAVDYNCRQVDRYPYSEELIKGSMIPHFEEAKKIVEDFIRKNSVTGYCEWYLTVSDSVCRLAGHSSRPCAEYLQAPYLPFRKGMRYLIAGYLDKETCYYGPERPYGTKISRIDRSGVEFYWKKPERATGYDVFRSYSEDGPYELIAEIRKRSKGVNTDDNFDHSCREIFYSVRSVIEDPDGLMLYSVRTEPIKAEYIEQMRPDRGTLYMYSGSSRKVNVSYGWGEPDDAVWTSGCEDIAYADSNGMITAMSAGRCTIRCESPSLGQSCEIEVEVDRKPPEPIAPESTRYHFDPVSGYWKDPSAGDTGQALIMMTGDMMCSSNQMRRQYDDETGWDFSESFEYVHPATSASDLAVGNLETLLAAGWPYMVDEAFIDNTNNCNAPSRYLDAVRYGGFDMLMLSNNHNCDGGVRALIETIEQVERYEFPYTGVFKGPEDRRFVIADVNGIKVGFLSYMSARTSFNGKDASWSKKEKRDHLNIFAEEKAIAAIKECRAAGAEYVIVYMHWGAKNFRNLTEDQMKLAQGAANAGADFIIGSNPHVIQIYDELISEDGRVVPCYYSVGNFLSVMNQVPGNRDSIMVAITLKRQPDGSIALIGNEYIPFHCFNKIGERRWVPVPLSKRYNKTKKKGAEQLALIRSFIGDKAKESM